VWGGDAWSFGLDEGMKMMRMDERIRFLLRAALRAEGEGDLRVAELFRRMADELRPMGCAQVMADDR
jgi:hypothetical protein